MELLQLNELNPAKTNHGSDLAKDDLTQTDTESSHQCSLTLILISYSVVKTRLIRRGSNIGDNDRKVVDLNLTMAQNHLTKTFSAWLHCLRWKLWYPKAEPIGVAYAPPTTSKQV